MAPPNSQEKRVGSIKFYRARKKAGGVDGFEVFEGEFGGRSAAVKRIEREFLGNGIEHLSSNDFLALENVAPYIAKEDSEDFTYLAMELFSGNLENFVKGELKGLTIHEALRQMARGVHQLHSRGYVHGNLKPSNVLIAKLDSGRMAVKLADFQYHRNVASPADNLWRAPEAHGGTSTHEPAVDVFSLGCLFCYALTDGSHPFGEESVRITNMTAGRIDWEVLEKIRDGTAKDLVKSMISREAKSRPLILTIIQNPTIASESNVAQLRSPSISHNSNRIPREGVSIGESPSIGVEVYEAWMGNKMRAIKKINIKQYRTNYKREVNIMTMPDMSNCPYLVRYFSHEEDEGMFCYIEMERCIASLKTYIENKQFEKRIADKKMRRLFQKKIVDGVSFLHSFRINLIHRDLKPSNILISEDGGTLIPKISDYGISESGKNDTYQSTTLYRGTDGWRAPEINSLCRFSKSVDCFALGCLLFYIETNGGHPFNHHELHAIGKETQRNIDKYNPKLDLLSNIEPTLRDIICKVLEKESEDRISANQMLEHPAFFTNEQALNFLREVCEQNKPADLDNMFKILNQEEVNMVIGDDWIKRLEPVVRKEVAIGPNKQIIKKIQNDSKYGTSLSNLLHLIRNKYAHFREMNANAKEVIGETQDKYFEYWQGKFPHLLITTWNVTKQQKLSKLILEFHREVKKTMSSPKAKSSLHELVKKSRVILGESIAPRKTVNEFIFSRTRPQLPRRRSYFEFLTDFPFEVIGRLGASHHLENTKKEMVYRLRHRLGIGADDASGPVDDNHNKRSTYEALLELIDDHDPSAICEIFQLMLESRFTVPLFNPLTNDSHLALFGDIYVSAVPNEPPIALGCDTRLSRVVLASCRSPIMSQSLELLKELFNLDTLHRNDMLDKSFTSQHLTIDMGVGLMGYAQEQHHVLVVHVAGEFDKAIEFINGFADVLLVEDTPTWETSTMSFSKLYGKGMWNDQSMLTLLWKPSNTNRSETPLKSASSLRQARFPPILLKMQYGSMLNSILVKKLMHHFNNDRRLDRKDVSNLELLEGQLSTFDYPSSKTEDYLNSFGAGIGETRRNLKLQVSFREQSEFEEKQREHRLDEEKSKEYEEKISACIDWRQDNEPVVGEISLLKHFRDMLSDDNQSKRVTRIRRLEQYLSRLSETELQSDQDKIDQLHAQLLRSGLNDEDRNRLKDDFLQAKNDYRDSVLNLEHLWRELSHLYVANPLKYEDIPRLAAQHLLDGFTIELLDGDANLLNLPWIQTVLGNLNQLMKSQNRRMFVLSVMGVQSSGKSTLLNTMFGIKLRTSVGQCTRGINMQLVPVSGRNEYDYLLVLDTEGMRSPDYHGMEGNEKRDNQMATLSILLADATVVVNPGENDIAIREVLPIVLMAYDRSKLAEKSGARLSSMMFFVYNRIDTMQHEKLSNIVQTLNHSLNEAFRMIGSGFESERCLFRDFYLDVSNSNESDVRILGNNKKSFTPPNNVPDPTYGATLAEFREHIHRRVTIDSSDWKSHTPNDLSTYLGKIWECICSADFSIQFKHVLHMMAFEEIETEYLVIEREIVSSYKKKFSDVQKALEKEASLVCPAEIAANNHQVYNSLLKRLNLAMNRAIADLDNRFSRAVTQKGREQWRPSYEQRWKLFKDKQEDYWCRQLRYIYDANVTYEFQVDQLKNDMRTKINDEIAEKGPSSLTDKELRRNFDSMMNEFVEKAKKNSPSLQVHKCVNELYAESATIQSQQISLNSSDLNEALKVAQSRERHQLVIDFVDCLSRHWPVNGRESFKDMEILLRDIQNRIKRQLEHVRFYDDGIVSCVIEDTENAIIESKKSENWQRELAHAFARSYLIHCMERLQRNWEARYLVWAKFNRKTNWESMWEYYRMASQGANKIKLFTVLISKKFEHLHKAYKSELVAISLQEVKKRLGNNHWAPAHMENQLIHVLQSNQLAYLLHYIKNPNELQIQVLRQMVGEHVLYAISHNKTWHQFVSNLSKCVSRATNYALKPGSDTRAGRFVTSLRTGLAKSLASNVLTKNIDRTLSHNFVQVNEIQQSEFRDECERVLRKLINEQRDPCEVFCDFADQVINAAINELQENGGLTLRCQHCCPCCGSMCIREAGHSAFEKHNTKHQPTGLVGWKLDGSLDWRTCYDLKPSDKLVRGSRRFFFRDWSAMFPEWEPPPDRLGNRNALQEYIFYNYNSAFAQFYNTKQCDSVPVQYNRDWNDVLREVYSEKNFPRQPPTPHLYKRGYGSK